VEYAARQSRPEIGNRDADVRSLEHLDGGLPDRRIGVVGVRVGEEDDARSGRLGIDTRASLRSRRCRRLAVVRKPLRGFRLPSSRDGFAVSNDSAARLFAERRSALLAFPRFLRNLATRTSRPVTPVETSVASDRPRFRPSSRGPPAHLAVSWRGSPAARTRSPAPPAGRCPRTAAPGCSSPRSWYWF